jgi:hypothetical protein
MLSKILQVPADITITVAVAATHWHSSTANPNPHATAAFPPDNVIKRNCKMTKTSPGMRNWSQTHLRQAISGCIKISRSKISLPELSSAIPRS